MAETETTEKKDRTASLAESRTAKMDLLFKGKTYKIAKEVNLEGEQRFVTPFGNKGRNGFALTLVKGDAAEIDGEKQTKFIVGASMLKQAHETYGAIEGGIPEKPRKRRTKEQKAADDAREAEEKAAKAEKEKAGA